MTHGEVDWDKVDFNDTAIVVTPGWYDVQVIKTEATVASTGSPMIKLAVEILGGPYDTRWVFTNLVFNTDSSTNMRLVMKRLAAFGLGSEYLETTRPTMAALADSLMNREAQAEVTVRQWQGEDRNDINTFRAKGVGAVGAGTGGDAPPPPPTLTPDPAAAPTIAPAAPSAPPAADEEPF